MSKERKLEDSYKEMAADSEREGTINDDTIALLRLILSPDTGLYDAMKILRRYGLKLCIKRIGSED